MTITTMAAPLVAEAAATTAPTFVRARIVTATGACASKKNSRHKNNGKRRERPNANACGQKRARYTTITLLGGCFLFVLFFLLPPFRIVLGMLF